MKSGLLLVVLLATWTGQAFAGVKLVNQDGKSHDLLVKCSSASDTSISGSSTRDLGNGPCAVTVKATSSSASGSGSDTLVIKDGKVTKK